MVARRRAAPAFRPSAPVVRSSAPSRSQTIALLTGVVLIAAAVAVASFVVKPSRARSFDLFYGSMFINDNTSPVAVDLASGKPTIGLHDAYTAVSAKTTADLDMVGLSGGNTLMLNPATGEFNMVDSTGFVAKTTDGGVPLPQGQGVTHTSAVPAGDSAYMLQSSDATSSVFLVNAATVSSAVGVHAKVKARASIGIKAPLSDVSAPAAAANGDLWVLTDPAPQSATEAARTHTLTQLSVPAGSNPGTTLKLHRHGQVRGIAAVAVATRNSDGTGGDVPAVATSTSVQIFAGAQPVSVPVPVKGAVTDILPATNAQGEFGFLYRTSTGWTSVRASASGTGAASVHRLTQISPGATLIAPAASDGGLYTMDTTGAGNLWQIGRDGRAQKIDKAGTYPVRPGERSDLSQSQVLARGSRVIFNARSNYEALVVFTDGSHPPRVLDKHSAVLIDPTSATRLADLRTTATDSKPSTSKPTKTAPKTPAQPINNRINCSTSSQTPNIPTLTAGQRASRSIVLTWTYPLLEVTDCVPSTYVVSVKVLTPGAPSTAGSVTVQGQNGVTLTGLFPATQYQMTVTAYINKHGTSSKPIDVSTGPEGPAAPTDVRAVPTSTGDWTISWNSCGGVKKGCVQSTQWTVIPRYCDNRGLSNVPTPLAVVADPTVHSFTQTYPGSDALLGRGLCFAVQGQSPQGTNGAVSAYTSPAYSWSPPVASDLHLTASQPDNTALGGSASTSVNLSLGSDPVRAVGGVGATVTFTLNGPGSPRTKTITFDGKSDTLSTSFPGIQAGAQYTAQATVHAPNHPNATASTPTVTVTTRANWPSLSVDEDRTSCAPDPFPSTTCTLTVHINGLSSASAGGELFKLVDSALVCDTNDQYTLTKSSFDPLKQDITLPDVNLFECSGTHSLKLALSEDSNETNPPVFGGTTSPTFTGQVTIGQASAWTATSDDFEASFSTTDPTVTIQFTKQSDYAAAQQLTTGWHEQLYAPDGTQCGGENNGVGGQPDVTLKVGPYDTCNKTQGNQSGWYYTVTYHDKRDGTPHTLTNLEVSGNPVGYEPPCKVEGTFVVAWNDAPDHPSVSVAYTSGNADDLDGCSNFTYTLQQPPAVAYTTCNSIDVGDTPPTASQAIDATACSVGLASTDPWRVEITYKSARSDQQPIDVIVPGNPPHN